MRSDRRLGIVAGARALDRDLDLRVRPAAVIAEVAGGFARSVVDHRLQDVVARLGERRGRRRGAVGELRLRGGEDHVARPAVFRPQHRHAGRLRRSALLRQPVVGRRDVERRAARGLIGDADLHVGRQIRTDLLAVAAARRAKPIDLPHRLQRGDDLLRLAVRVHGPHELLVAEVLRHGHLEDVLVAPRREVGRLAAIDTRLERVVRTDGDVELLS